MVADGSNWFYNLLVAEHKFEFLGTEFLSKYVQLKKDWRSSDLYYSILPSHVFLGETANTRNSR